MRHPLHAAAQFVPCIHCIGHRDTPYMFPVSVCEAAASEGIFLVECQKVRFLALCGYVCEQLTTLWLQYWSVRLYQYLCTSRRLRLSLTSAQGKTMVRLDKMIPDIVVMAGDAVQVLLLLLLLLKPLLQLQPLPQSQSQTQAYNNHIHSHSLCYRQRSPSADPTGGAGEGAAAGTGLLRSDLPRKMAERGRRHQGADAEGTKPSSLLPFMERSLIVFTQKSEVLL